MGASRSTRSFEAELKEFCKEMAVMLQHRQQGISYNNTNSSSKLLSAVDRRRRNGMVLFPRGDQMKMEGEGGDDGEQETVCVTSGISFLGFAVANRLLARGYSVRLLLDTQEDMEKVREMGMIFGSATASHGGEEEDDEMNNNINSEGAWRAAAAAAAVVGDMTDLESLCQAFQGCCCVFHTSAFSDPTGVSGYSKHMAETEARTAERVIEACVRTESVKKCVFTSSLLACIWRGNSPHNNRFPIMVDENCWSDESLCRDRKLWYALGKTMAEKAAWRAARGRDLKLVTLCPGLVTGPGFRRRNSTASIAYLKGGHEMLRDGLLATMDVSKLAEAHVGVYEAMSRTACGRYICFDHIIRRVEDVAELERQLGIPNRTSSSSSSSSVAASGSGGLDQDQPPPTWSELSKRKLTRLMSSTRRRCSSYNIHGRTHELTGPGYSPAHFFIYFLKIL